MVATDKLQQNIPRPADALDQRRARLVTRTVQASALQVFVVRTQPYVLLIRPTLLAVKRVRLHWCHFIHHHRWRNCVRWFCRLDHSCHFPALDCLCFVIADNIYLGRVSYLQTALLPPPHLLPPPLPRNSAAATLRWWLHRVGTSTAATLGSSAVKVFALYVFAIHSSLSS